LVLRLGDYKWSSYLAYGYGRRAPKWLKMDLILSRFEGNDPHGAYRKKVQGYSGEEAKIWEDLRHGLIMGTEDFVNRIRARYVGNAVNPEIPQQGRMLKTLKADEVLQRASTVFDFDLDKWRRSRWISRKDGSAGVCTLGQRFFYQPADRRGVWAGVFDSELAGGDLP